MHLWKYSSTKIMMFLVECIYNKFYLVYHLVYFSDSMDEFRQLSIREFVVSSLSKRDQGLGVDQTKQTKDWIWTRRNRPMFGYWPDETDRRLGIDQMEQTDVWVLARPNRPKIGYGSDETDQFLGIGQTEHTQFRYGPDRTDLISVWARRSGATENLFRLWAGSHRTPPPPVRDPGPPGPYLSWVADFIYCNRLEGYYYLPPCVFG